MQVGIWRKAPKVRERLKIGALNVEVNYNSNETRWKVVDWIQCLDRDRDKRPAGCYGHNNEPSGFTNCDNCLIGEMLFYQEKRFAL